MNEMRPARKRQAFFLNHCRVPQCLLSHHKLIASESVQISSIIGCKPVESPTQLPGNINVELLRRHKAAATTVAGLLVAVVLLSAVAFFGRRFFTQQQNPLLDVGLRIVILILGLGAIVLRRTRFATLRLQDIGALKGATGLLATLEKTTLQLALLGAGIGALGFIGTVVTGNDIYTYWAGLISIVVLLYCYPSRKAWKTTVEKFAPYDIQPQPISSEA